MQRVVQGGMKYPVVIAVAFCTQLLKGLLVLWLDKKLYHSVNDNARHNGNDDLCDHKLWYQRPYPSRIGYLGKNNRYRLIAGGNVYRHQRAHCYKPPGVQIRCRCGKTALGDTSYNCPAHRAERPHFTQRSPHFI